MVESNRDRAKIDLELENPVGRKGKLSMTNYGLGDWNSVVSVSRI